MPLQGLCLKMRFSVNNQLGVVANDVQMGETSTPPDLAVLQSEVNPLFGGQLVNLSKQIYRMLESEKNAQVDNPTFRYSRKGVAGTYWKTDFPDDQVPFYLAGVGAWVDTMDVRAFITAHCKMADGSAPEQVFVGAFKNLE